MDWQKIWDTIVNFFRNNAWNILIFVAVLFFGVMAVKLLLNILRRVLKRTSIEPIAISFMMAIVKFLLYLVLVFILLDILGIGLTWLVTAFSAAFLAIGLALQNNIANMANGIIIVSSGMFKKGDYIEVDGVEGSISKINFLYVTIITSDNKRITLPNSKILNEVVTNYDSNNTRRVNFEFEVAYENDVEKVKKIVLDCMNSNGKVRLDPAPFCRLKTLGEHNLLFVGRCWCDREDYWAVYYDITETVFNEFKRCGITIAYNQLEIRQRTDCPQNPVCGEGLPVRVEKKRKKKRDFDLENVDLAEIFNFNRKNKKAKQIENSKENKNVVAKAETATKQTADKKAQ